MVICMRFDQGRSSEKEQALRNEKAKLFEEDFFGRIDAHSVPEEKNVRKIEPIKNYIGINFRRTVHI